MFVTEKIKDLLAKYRSEVTFVLVGGLTTLVNFIVYVIAREIFDIHYIAANVAAWIIAVLFAYVMSRIWVFQSKNTNIFLEIMLFFASRLFSLLLETGLLLGAVELLNVNDLYAKIAVAIVVVISNYVTGKWIVFKKRK